MTNSKLTLKKDERIKKKRESDLLFKEGKSTFSYPLKAKYLLIDRNIPQYSAKIMVSVPKKKVKRAYKRNLIRRRVKEAYRINKVQLNKAIPHDKTLLIALIYINNEAEKFETIEKGVLKLFSKIEL
ncbi:ribonuclease P protein component [Marinilabiliaceae bacterium ANBcel2]|nr:ribonuclease P protein component [Marinilabiliaceae bacterium ANBcel2]